MHSLLVKLADRSKKEFEDKADKLEAKMKQPRITVDLQPHHFTKTETEATLGSTYRHGRVGLKTVPEEWQTAGVQEGQQFLNERDGGLEGKVEDRSCKKSRSRGDVELPQHS